MTFLGGRERPEAVVELTSLPRRVRQRHDEARTLLNYLIEHGDILERRRTGPVFAALITPEVRRRLEAFDAEMDDIEQDLADFEISAEEDGHAI